MQHPFHPLNNYFDKIYVLTLPRLHDRIAFIKEQLQGLDFDFFYGTDKQDTSIEQLRAAGLYSTERRTFFNKKPVEMPLGMLCCALGHAAIYKDIIKNDFSRVLILEDDVVPLPTNLALFEDITKELPADWDICYLGYEKNETYGWKQRWKKIFYMLFPHHTRLKMTRRIYSNLYPRTLSKHIAVAGFHDCTHAYCVTLNAAKKLLELQTPAGFNPDSLLSYAICTGQLKGYIVRPKLFNQLTAFTSAESLTS